MVTGLFDGSRRAELAARFRVFFFRTNTAAMGCKTHCRQNEIVPGRTRLSRQLSCLQPGLVFFFFFTFMAVIHMYADAYAQSNGHVPYFTQLVWGRKSSLFFWSLSVCEKRVLYSHG